MAARVSTAFPDHTRAREDTRVRARTAKGVAALQLSTTRPGNEPSRSLGLLPNKIYIRIQGETLFFFTSSYIILGVPSSVRSHYSYAYAFSVCRGLLRRFDLSWIPDVSRHRLTDLGHLKNDRVAKGRHVTS